MPDRRTMPFIRHQHLQTKPASDLVRNQVFAMEQSLIQKSISECNESETVSRMEIEVWQN